ncbi:hypothetical protein ACNFU2_06430 [Chryseobacterium sp. PTM-20240506]|uniref:hypothetical protein n=1 Tax=Chryseobacterium sp. PTM-20240506 TaxID=3400631 RepID=UPI003AAF7941
MEVKGFIEEIGPNYIRLLTYHEKQEVDIFFDSDLLKEAVSNMKLGAMYIGNVRVQSVEVNGQKLARFLMWFGGTK